MVKGMLRETSRNTPIEMLFTLALGVAIAWEIVSGRFAHVPDFENVPRLGVYKDGRYQHKINPQTSKKEEENFTTDYPTKSTSMYMLQQPAAHDRHALCLHRPRSMAVLPSERIFAEIAEQLGQQEKVAPADVVEGVVVTDADVTANVDIEDYPSEAITVSVEDGDRVLVRGETKSGDATNWQMRKFERVVELPDGVDVATMEASASEDGKWLTIKVAMKKRDVEATTKNIPIKITHNKSLK